MTVYPPARPGGAGAISTSFRCATAPKMNARLKRLGINSIWMSLSRLGAQGLGVGFTVLLGRGLGSAGFGEYAFLAAVLTTGNALTTFGTDMHLIRQIASQGKLSGLGEALAIQLGLSLLFIAGVA